MDSAAVRSTKSTAVSLRYESKRSSDYECWAIVDGTPVELLQEHRITIDDPDLVVAARHRTSLP